VGEGGKFLRCGGLCEMRTGFSKASFVDALPFVMKAQIQIFFLVVDMHA